MADDAEDAAKFESFYKKKPLPSKDYYIAGVQEEALGYYKSPEAYRNSIENKIKANTWIEKRYTEQILRNIDFVKYSDRTLIILRIQNEVEAIKFDSKYYERQGTHTKEVTSEAGYGRVFSTESEVQRV